MSGSHLPNGAIPRMGRVTEICQEWMVREDSAIAHHLQDQEIRQHYTGNKQRNALLREDYPTAKSEQQKEQELAEQATAIYKKMLEEQEEIDKMMAERLMQKLELDERTRRGMEETDMGGPRILQEEFEKPPVLRQLKPQKKTYQQVETFPLHDSIEQHPEPLFSRDLPDAQYSSQDLNAPNEQRTFKTQEEADEELARRLQEEEGNLEECIQQRDRLLAIEAQDKELAKVLQERERMKVKRAKEKARQKALAKKQQKRQEEALSHDTIMPDDAYSNPADVISPQMNASASGNYTVNYAPRPYDEYEDNYSLPVDSEESTVQTMPEYPYNSNRARPTHLNVKPMYKPRYPEPKDMETKQHSNIAMAIDPTYTKQDLAQSPGTYSQNFSLERGITSKSPSKSPKQSSKQTDEKLENSPPYMPIQGQKRTTLEKRRVKDGCKQQ